MAYLHFTILRNDIGRQARTHVFTKDRWVVWRPYGTPMITATLIIWSTEERREKREERREKREKSEKRKQRREKSEEGREKNEEREEREESRKKREERQERREKRDKQYPMLLFQFSACLWYHASRTPPLFRWDRFCS